MMARLQDKSIYVVGAGAQTPVGRSVPAAAAAVRCGLSAYAEHPFMIDQHGEPMVVAYARWLDAAPALEDRVVRLAVDAAREALSPVTTHLAAARSKLAVHVAISAETFSNEMQRRSVVDRLAAAVDFSGRLLDIESFVAGHAGGLLALEAAVRRMRSGKAELCLVGGADSWLDPERLEAIDRAGRLHSTRCSRGFTPGEGAGFCLLATGVEARRLGLTPLAELLSVATAAETKPMGTRTVCTGEGLTAAFRAVLDPRWRVAHSYCDFNGESYRTDEYGFTLCRTSEHFEDPTRFTAAAECWGDVGAASGPLALTLPLAASALGSPGGQVSLVWSSSASGPLRGAALLNRWSP